VDMHECTLSTVLTRQARAATSGWAHFLNLLNGLLRRVLFPASGGNEIAIIYNLITVQSFN
jgi:hypothetical protein